MNGIKETNLAAYYGVSIPYTPYNGDIKVNTGCNKPISLSAYIFKILFYTRPKVYL